MKIYNYSHFTHEYLFESDASIDKEASKAEGRDVYYLPADATFTKPPKTLKFEVAVYENGWQKKADYRDCWMVDNEMQPKKQDKIGDLPDGFIYVTDAQAAKIQDDDLFYVIEDGQLIENPNYAEQKKAREDARINNLTMTALDFIGVLEGFGLVYVTQIKPFLEAHPDLEKQLRYCQNVWCGVAKQVFAEPITIGNITVTADMVEQAFKNKHGEN